MPSTDMGARFLSVSEREAFASRVWDQGTAHRRSLPWRGIDDAYGVLVSEIMLQQTQVARVLGFWEAWMAAFPTIDALASADVADVLERWQGLGYNRRALALKRTGDICSAEQGGSLPRTEAGLIALPGIGPATAAGVMAFAYRQPAVYLETNVRAVFIHEFFDAAAEKVPDRLIEPLVRQTCCVEDPRGWYYALLDYGAHLKKVLPNPGRRSASYSRQGAFEGSRRQKRAEIVRLCLARESIGLDEIALEMEKLEHAAGRPSPERQAIASIVDDLHREGFLVLDDERYSIR